MPGSIVRYAMVVASFAAVLFGVACKPSTESTGDQPKQPVVLYSSVDERFLREVVATYERETGGRSNSLPIRKQARRPDWSIAFVRKRIDPGRMFWSSEQSQTVLLAREGLLAPYDSPSAADIDPLYRDKDHLWTGFALRARVVAYDPEKTESVNMPKYWKTWREDIASNLAIANPLFGTTADT
ncbi:MAG: ABC transporter substrate-binding protein [Phycisphaerae bacterium]